ncbi:MAG TPA: hypothetical protein VFR68_12400 [Candidatus Dormibacteraeota bacterium]|nr:hypothetical protein [Candidatus Dormibacteraeota bacterium]
MVYQINDEIEQHLAHGSLVAPVRSQDGIDVDGWLFPHGDEIVLFTFSSAPGLLAHDNSGLPPRM